MFMRFLIKVFSPFFLVSSLLLFFYIFYRSELIFNGQNRSAYLIYYYTSIIFILSSIFTFFLSKEKKQYLIISLISIVFALYLFEIYLEFFKQKIDAKNYEKNFNIKFDSRNRIDVFKDLKKTDASIRIIVPPSNQLSLKNNIFPVSGISNSKTIYCNENGYYSIFESDRYGFNNPDDQWDKKKIEYLIVGDSYAMGACVNRPNDIGSVLRSFSESPVLNLAYGGNGPLIEYVTLREYLSDNVKNVLWIYYEGNDFSDLNLELKDEILKKYFNDLNFKQDLKTKQNQIDHMLDKFIIKELRNSLKNRIINFIKIRKTRFLLTRSKIIQEEPKLQPEFRKILQKAKDLTKKNKSNLYFIYLPSYNRYQANYEGYDFNYSSVKKIVKELDIIFIDILNEVFEKEDEPLSLFPIKPNSHYNSKSYKRIAETIIKHSRNYDNQ